MSGKTIPNDAFSQQGGTNPADNFSSGFGGSKKKTMVEGQEEVTQKENPKNLNMLAGFLVSFSKTDIGEYWDLREGNNSIGSTQENDIVLAEKHISGKHANINVSRDTQNNCWKFQLVDLSSTNGTDLNGTRLPIYSGVELKNNDTLKIGEYVMMLFTADKFQHKLSKNEKFQGATQGINYDSRDFFSSGNDVTRAEY